MHRNSQARVRTEETPYGTRIMIRGRLSLMTAVTITLGLGVWAVGAVVLLVLMFVPDAPAALRLLFVVFLVFWSTGAIRKIRRLLHHLMGSDVLLLSSTEPRIGRRLFGFERLAAMDVDQFRSVRVVPDFSGTGWLQFGGGIGVRVGEGLRMSDLSELQSFILDWVDHEDRRIGRPPAERPNPQPAPSVPFGGRYLFPGLVDLSLTRRGEDADAQSGSSVGRKAERG